MANIFLSGLCNIETTVQIEKFPIEYTSIHYPFFGVDSSVSGVGINYLANAFKTLGDEVNIHSYVWQDANGEAVLSKLKSIGVDTNNVRAEILQTAHTVVLYDKNGKRQIYCDLKDIQDKSSNADSLKQDIKNSDIAVLCNINYNRNLLPIAREMGVTVATDVHVLSEIDDEYNADFMKYADILFLSDENVKEDKKKFVRKLAQKYNNRIIVMGLGDKGALLYTSLDKNIIHVPAVKTRRVINTVGAGDSLFSSFLHFYLKNEDAHECLKKTVCFASWKIGESGASKGHITEKELLKLYSQPLYGND